MPSAACWLIAIQVVVVASVIFGVFMWGAIKWIDMVSSRGWPSWLALGVPMLPFLVLITFCIAKAVCL